MSGCVGIAQQTGGGGSRSQGPYWAPLMLITCLRGGCQGVGGMAQPAAARALDALWLDITLACAAQRGCAAAHR
jgi:hypothetical protein